jgi:hypothetical protein
MTIEQRGDEEGVRVYLDSNECELFNQLARDAETVGAGAETLATGVGGAASYFSVSLALGMKIRSLKSTRHTP